MTKWPVTKWPVKETCNFVLSSPLCPIIMHIKRVWISLNPDPVHPSLSPFPHLLFWISAGSPLWPDLRSTLLFKCGSCNKECSACLEPCWFQTSLLSVLFQTSRWCFPGRWRLETSQLCYAHWESVKYREHILGFSPRRVWWHFPYLSYTQISLWHAPLCNNYSTRRH